MKKTFLICLFFATAAIGFAQTSSPVSRIVLRRHHAVLTINWNGLPLEYDDAKGEFMYGGANLPPAFFNIENGVVFTRYRDPSETATFGKLQQIEGVGSRIVFAYYDGDSPAEVLGKLKWIEIGTGGDRLQFLYNEKTGKPIAATYKRERMTLDYFPAFADKDLAGKLHGLSFSSSNNYQFEYYNSEGDEFSHGNLYSIEYNNNKMLIEYAADRIRPLGTCLLPVFMEVR